GQRSPSSPPAHPRGGVRGARALRGESVRRQGRGGLPEHPAGARAGGRSGGGLSSRARGAARGDAPSPPRSEVAVAPRRVACSAEMTVTGTLPDGKALELQDGATGADAAAAIGPGLARAALAVEVGRAGGGEEPELHDLGRPLPDGARIAILTENSGEQAL